MCCKLHIYSVNYKVLTYLRSPNWDTRIAAGQAVEAIVKNIPEWNPSPKPKEGELLCLVTENISISVIWMIWSWAICATLNAASVVVYVKWSPTLLSLFALVSLCMERLKH